MHSENGQKLSGKINAIRKQGYSNVGMWIRIHLQRESLWTILKQFAVVRYEICLVNEIMEAANAPSDIWHGSRHIWGVPSNLIKRAR